MKRLLLLLIALAVAAMPLVAWGQDEAGGPSQPEASSASGTGETPVEAEEAPEEAEELPPMQYELKPELYTWLGARVVDVDGSNRAIEFGWPHSSVAGGFVFMYVPLPHRLDVELDWRNPKDYRAELSYAYKDMLKLEYTGLGLWHNLDHFVPQPVNDEMNPGRDYNVAVNDHRAFLRLKLPEKAYHVFFNFRQFDKDGSKQATWDEGGALLKGSKARDIDWVTRRFVAGLNGHFGPVELEYSHNLKKFRAGGETALVDLFSGTSLVHSVMPELTTNSDTLRAHTSYTGRVVAAATLTAGRKKNDNSNSTLDFNRAFGDLTIIPFKDVTVAIKYRFRQTEESVPAVVTIPTRSTLSSPTIHPIEQRSNTAQVSVRYTPSRSFGVRAEYDFENLERHNADLWSDPQILPFQPIPEEQDIHRVKLFVNARPVRPVSLRGSLEYAYTGQPALPTLAKNSFKGRFDAEWDPLPTTSCNLHYTGSYDQNSSASMGSRYDNAGALAVWSPLPRLSITANYDYFRTRNTRDIMLTEGVAAPDVPLPTDRVALRDSAHTYALAAGYTFAIPLSLTAEYRQSWSRSTFRTTTTDGVVSAAGIGELTDLKIRETGGGLTVRYDLPKGWGSSVSYRVDNYEDMADKPQTGNEDGTAHTVLVMLSRKW